MVTIISRYKVERYSALVLNSPTADFLSPVVYVAEMGLTKNKNLAKFFRKPKQAIERLIEEIGDWGPKGDIPKLESEFFLHDNMTSKLWRLEFMVKNEILRWNKKELTEEQASFTIAGHDVFWQ